MISIEQSRTGSNDVVVLPEATNAFWRSPETMIKSSHRSAVLFHMEEASCMRNGWVSAVLLR